ncbi:DUF6011 domain-containing protein [Streptomyces sp. NBC_01262]|uniref:DUF6011 domain-containing protein n=1 Tax=Streptomyces sp. NBC_01262 TaxID=2903803 RepID=UPI002E3481E0|nr:DUF6011 domain-containing protein [Streptomyces sp. NBC_01262]
MPTPAGAPAPLTGLDLDTVQGPPAVCCELCKADLTNSASRRWGLGRHCRRKLGLTGARSPGRFAVDQEQLPGT